MGLCLAGELQGGMIIKYPDGTTTILRNFPTVFARSLLTNPWIELGGECEVLSGEEKGQLKFHLKSLTLESEANSVTGKIDNNVVLTANWQDDPFGERSRRYIIPENQLDDSDSRKIWKKVSTNLLTGDLDKAWIAKEKVETTQRHNFDSNYQPKNFKLEKCFQEFYVLK